MKTRTLIYGLPVALLLTCFWQLDASADDDTQEQIAQLKAQIAELQAEVEYLTSQNADNDVAVPSLPPTTSSDSVVIESAPIEVAPPNCTCSLCAPTVSYYTPSYYYAPSYAYYPYGGFYSPWGYGYGGWGSYYAGYYPAYRGWFGRRSYFGCGLFW